jgi:hypothetical protein
LPSSPHLPIHYKAYYFVTFFVFCFAFQW